MKMKNHNISVWARRALGATLALSLAAPFLSTPARADDDNWRDNRRERREDRREDRRDRRQDRREDRRDDRHDRWERRNDRYDDRRGGYYNPGYGYGGGYGYGRPRYDNGYGYGGGYGYGNGYGNGTLTGVVVREYSNDRFDLRVGGRIVRVEPRGDRNLASHDTGDLVQLYGVHRGGVFIADSLRVLRNR